MLFRSSAHMAVLTGADFFTLEVLIWRGLATYYVLFFIQLETRRITLAGITRRPTAEWMLQMSRNATDEESGHLDGRTKGKRTSCCFLGRLRIEAIVKGTCVVKSGSAGF